MITGILIISPLLASILIMMQKKNTNIRLIALISSILIFIFSIIALITFKNSAYPETLMTIPWMSSLGIDFRFAFDGISLMLILLTTFLIPIIILASYTVNRSKLHLFYGLIFLMEMALIGVFSSQDLLVFYLFWELTLIPAYFITAAWGGENRIKITFKFFIYTLFGSLVMLAAIIFIYFKTPLPHSFSFDSVFTAHLTSVEQIWIFSAFFLAFAIKIPIFPFHTWQPDTYTVAPPAGSMLLAGLMLKMGIYGIIRFILPMCSLVLDKLALPAIILSVTGIIYASIIALRQNDLKKLIAYVSIAHVGLMAAGSFVLNISTLQGVILQMISHGINVVGLFIVIDIIERRFNTRQISDLGGLVHKMPLFSILFMIILLGSIALPLTNGFAGEFLIFLGLFKFNPWLTAIAGLTIIFGAIYMLWMYQRVMLGKINENLDFSKSVLKWYELAALIPVAVLVIFIGVFPSLFLRISEPAINLIIYTINAISIG